MKRIPAEANPRFRGRIQNHPIGDYSFCQQLDFGLAAFLMPENIAQKQILIWDDYDDLTKKLAEWIRALFE